MVYHNKRGFMLFILCVYIILTSCSNRDSSNNEITNNKNSDSIEQQENKSTDKSSPVSSDIAVITISNWVDDAFFKATCDKFMAKFPNVEIIIESSDDYVKYMTQMSTKIMAGDAGDLFYSTGYNIEKQIESGILTDLNEFLTNDDFFTNETFFMDIYKAFEYKGGLYEFPTQICYDIVGINTRLPQEIQGAFGEGNTISMNKLVELYRKSTDANKQLLNSGISQTYYLDKTFDTLNYLLNNDYKYLDIINKTCDFLNQDFIDLINTGKELTEPSKEIMYYSSNMYFPEVDAEMAEKYLFNIVNCDQYQYFFGIEEYKSFTNYKPLVNDDGKMNISSPASYCLAESSENKDLCWELLKFMSTYEAHNSIQDLTFLPLNKELFKDVVEYQVNHRIVWLEETRDINFAQTTSELTKSIYPIYEKTMALPMKTSASISVYDIYLESLSKFREGSMTAEQVAQDLQNKISIALLE